MYVAAAVSVSTVKRQTGFWVTFPPCRMRPLVGKAPWLDQLTWKSAERPVLTAANAPNLAVPYCRSSTLKEYLRGISVA